MFEPLRVAIKQAETKIEDRYDWFREIVLFRLIPHADRLQRLLAPVRFLQHAGLFDVAKRMGLFHLIPGRLGRMISLVPPPVRQGPKLPKFLPAIGRKRARVAFFTGCVADALFRQVHWATLRVLQHNGCDIFVPPEQACCGAIHFHSGNGHGARQLADANLVAFELDRYDAIVVNHAGCGAMLKQYGLHWKDGLQPHRQRFAAKVKDVHELLDDLGLVPPSGRIPATATYHDACHLAHAQGITAAPRRILAKIPGLEFTNCPSRTSAAARPARITSITPTWPTASPAANSKTSSPPALDHPRRQFRLPAANPARARRKSSPIKGHAHHGTPGPELSRRAAVNKDSSGSTGS